MDSKLAVTPRNYFRTLNILFLALVGGQVIFALTTLLVRFMQPPKEIFNREVADMLLWVTLGAALAGVVFSQVLFRAKIKSLREKDGLPEKLQGYQSAMIIQFAMMEAPSLLALVLFLLTGNYIFLGAVAFVLLMFVINRPLKTALIQQLQLHDDEQMLLEDQDAVLFDSGVSDINKGF